MAEYLSIDDSDPSVLAPDFIELTENPETGSLRRRIQTTNTSTRNEPDPKRGGSMMNYDLICGCQRTTSQLELMRTDIVIEEFEDFIKAYRP
jgi:hypothetical protein